MTKTACQLCQDGMPHTANLCGVWLALAEQCLQEAAFAYHHPQECPNSRFFARYGLNINQAHGRAVPDLATSLQEAFPALDAIRSGLHRFNGVLLDSLWTRKYA
jgi:hypothetical protein